MSRDFKEYPCPKCASQNVEQKRQCNPRVKPFFRTVGRCFHCGHEWIIKAA